MYINPMNPYDGRWPEAEVVSTNDEGFVWANEAAINSCIDSMELQMLGIKP